MSPNGSFTFQDFYDPKAPEPAPLTPAEPQVSAPVETIEQESPAYEPTACGWTGLQKAGWFLFGLLGGPFGILVASMSNIGHPSRSTATGLAAGGFVATLALTVGTAVGLSLLGLGMAASLGATSL